MYYIKIITLNPNSPHSETNQKSCHVTGSTSCLGHMNLNAIPNLNLNFFTVTLTLTVTGICPFVTGFTGAR